MNAKKVVTTVALGTVAFVALRLVEELLTNVAPHATLDALADMIVTPKVVTP